MQEFKSSVDAHGPSLAEYGIKGDTYSWKEQLERTRNWKVWSWKVSV